MLPRLLTVYLTQVCGSLYDLTFSLHRPLRYNYIPSRRPLLVRTRDKGGNRWIILPMWASSISTQWSRDSPRAPQCQTSSLHPGSSLLPIPACHLRARRMTPPPPQGLFPNDPSVFNGHFLETGFANIRLLESDRHTGIAIRNPPVSITAICGSLFIGSRLWLQCCH